VQVKKNILSGFFRKKLCNIPYRSRFLKNIRK